MTSAARISEGLGENHRGAVLTHQYFVRRLIERIAAIDQVASQFPEIARATYRWSRLRSRHSVGAIGLRRRPLDQQLDFGDLEPGGVEAERAVLSGVARIGLQQVDRLMDYIKKGSR